MLVMKSTRARKEVLMAGKKNPIVYENVKVLSIDGDLMFRCSNKKSNWYLSRNLAILCSPGTIQLVFETNGMGNLGDKYMIEDRSNHCVVCGEMKSALTLHHVESPIVPDMYRKHMPTSVKSHSSRDLLLLCKYCHDSYEFSALKLKKQISQEYQMPLEGKGWVKIPDNAAVKKAAGALLGQRKLNESSKCHNIPTERLKVLEDIVKSWWAKKINICSDHLELTDDILHEAIVLKELIKADDFVEHGEYVITRLMIDTIVLEESIRWPKLEAFIKMWRQHFLDNAEPRHLSLLWSVDGEIYVR